MPIIWTCKPFEELKPRELYAILRLRNEVFVVEQNCAYQDEDNKDFYAFHVMGWLDGDLVAYARLLPPGISFTHAAIGRVVTSASVRGSGVGKELMTEAISILYSLWGKIPIQIGAQVYIQEFYKSLGFQQISPVYLEDGIDHIEMLLVPA